MRLFGELIGCAFWCLLLLGLLLLFASTLL
jgi:hypothetical protein